LVSKYRIAMVRLIHYGDWTEKTTDFRDLRFGIIGRSNVIGNKVNEYMYCQGDPQSYSKFVHDSRSSIVIEEVAKKGAKYRELILTRGYDKSILEIFREYNIMTLNTKINRGKEEYTIIMRNEDKENLIDELSVVAKILEFNVESRSGVYRPSESLSIRQISILKFALENGYFDTPRNIDLGKLSTIFGMTKTSASYNLKKAVKETLMGVDQF
jgi:predicted DNA binding protein